MAEGGLRVPHDFSIVGIVASHWAEDFHPALTAADVPVADMAAHAMALLTERISALGD